jgi:formiminoglutamase
MTKPIITQSQKRSLESIGSLFQSDASMADLVFLKSSSDVGVQRNGGRNGAKFAPQSFLSYFKKLTKHDSFRATSIAEVEVANEAEELGNFTMAQQLQATRIKPLINSSRTICHLGGGHDHIFPLLHALGEKYKKLIVLNVDAHADTRTDTDFHSGTPFRQFSESFPGEFTLLQIGLQPFANSASTLSNLKRGKQIILWRDEVAAEKSWENALAQLKIDDETAVIFSLDADALSGSEMPGVSAVNGHGLSRQELTEIWKKYHGLVGERQQFIGIYELNPVYDTLSMLSVRTLATFIYQALS